MLPEVSQHYEQIARKFKIKSANIPSRTTSLSRRGLKRVRLEPSIAEENRKRMHVFLCDIFQWP